MHSKKNNFPTVKFADRPLLHNNNLSSEHNENYQNLIKDIDLDKELAETQTNPVIVPHYLGHRKRLKAKFLVNEPSGFTDYELMELLLFQAIPRKDVKPLAKELIRRFGSIASIINTNKERLQEIPEVNENVILAIKLSREILTMALKQKITNKNAISSWSALLDYLKFNMGHLKIEQFRVLFLNKKNILIADEVMSVGTIDQTLVFPREIVKKCLYHEAGAIILVHNHPSGDVKPSKIDVDLTAEIVKACNTINVIVHDHVIIGEADYYSFKSNMLL